MAPGPASASGHPEAAGRRRSRPCRLARDRRARAARLRAAPCPAHRPLIQSEVAAYYAVSEALTNASGTFCAASSAVATSVAVFAALALPRRPVVMRARTITANPQAAMIHQPERDAAAKADGSGPCR